VSSHGACITAQVFPPIGSRVMFEIDLPRLTRNYPPSTELLLRAEGTIVRHDHGRAEFAASITYASLETPSLEQSE
jgi:hypothetical protein